MTLQKKKRIEKYREEGEGVGGGGGKFDWHNLNVIKDAAAIRRRT